MTTPMTLVDLRDAIAKAVADVIGHGMREKCERHADAVMAVVGPQLLATANHLLPSGKQCPEIFPGTHAALSALSIQPKGQESMIISEDQRASMLEAAKPLIAWMNENCHPHCEARVDQNIIILSEGIATNRTDEFMRD